MYFRQFFVQYLTIKVLLKSYLFLILSYLSSTSDEFAEVPIFEVLMLLVMMIILW